MTQKELLQAIVCGTPIDEEMKCFAKKWLHTMEEKQKKAAERVTKRRQENTKIGEQILGMLNEEPMTISDILVRLNNSDLTNQKISAIMRKLIETNPIEKVKVKVDGKEKVAYKLAENNEEEKDTKDENDD